MRSPKFIRAVLVAAASAALAISAHAADPIPVPGVLTSRAVFSCSDFTMSNGTIDSAGVSANTGSNHGDVVSNGTIRMSGNALVKGNVTAGPAKSITITGNASVTGTRTQLVRVSITVSQTGFHTVRVQVWVCGTTSQR